MYWAFILFSKQLHVGSLLKTDEHVLNVTYEQKRTTVYKCKEYLCQLQTYPHKVAFSFK